MVAVSLVRPLSPVCCRPSHVLQIPSETSTQTHRVSGYEAHVCICNRMLSYWPTTHQILYLCTDPYTVLEHVGQGDGVGKAQPHQPSIEGGGERYGGEGHCCQEHDTDKVDA